MEAHDTVFWRCRSVPRADLRHLVSFFRELGQCVSSSHTPAAMAHVSRVVVELRMEPHDTVFWGCRSVFQAGLSHLVVFFYETGQCVTAGAPDQMTIRGIEGIGTHHEMVRNLHIPIEPAQKSPGKTLKWAYRLQHMDTYNRWRRTRPDNPKQAVSRAYLVKKIEKHCHEDPLAYIHDREFDWGVGFRWRIRRPTGIFP